MSMLALDMASTFDNSGASVMELAVLGGHIDVVRQLLEAGVLPATVNGRQESALHTAAKLGRADCLEVSAERAVSLPANVTGWA